MIVGATYLIKKREIAYRVDSLFSSIKTQDEQRRQRRHRQAKQRETSSLSVTINHRSTLGEIENACVVIAPECKNVTLD